MWTILEGDRVPGMVGYIPEANGLVYLWQGMVEYLARLDNAIWELSNLQGCASGSFTLNQTLAAAQ